MRADYYGPDDHLVFHAELEVTPPEEPDDGVSLAHWDDQGATGASCSAPGCGLAS
jgi:hypothetical protein